MSSSRHCHARIAAVLDHRFPNDEIALSHFGQLLIEDVEADHRATTPSRELETGDEGKSWSCYLGSDASRRRLRGLGYEPIGITKCTGQHGPDFRVEHAGRTIWVKAVVRPAGIAADYLESRCRAGKIRVKYLKPDDEALPSAAHVCD